MQIIEIKLRQLNYISITEDENKLYFHTGLPTVATFYLVFNFIENSINQ